MSLKKTESYLRRRKKFEDKTIINQIKKRKAIVYGSKSVNKQLPSHLRTKEGDYDIFTKKPKKFSRVLEKKLDKKARGNFYETEPAIYEGTYKIKRRLSGVNVADVSKTPKKIGTISRNGITYANLQFQKGQIKKSLSDPESKFRHKKDKFTRTRIKLAEQKRKIRKVNQELFHKEQGDYLILR